MNALQALASYARPSAAPAAAACQLCAEAIDDGRHAHLVDKERGALLCACGSCGHLFKQAGPGGARYRTVPDRVLADPDFALSAVDCAALGIPVGLAFLFFNSRLGRWVALFPSPAGATEAELAQEPLAALAARAPLLRALEPDVEALLVRGRRGGAIECLGVSVEACYRLVGIVRRSWQGFHGGDEAWSQIDAFFSELRARAEVLA